MIVLVQPMLSKQELNADSNYVVCSALIRAILRQRPDWHFVMIWPDAHSGFKYEHDGFFHLPQITRVPQRISPRKMANAVTYDGIWWDQLMRRLGFDVVWCNLVEIAGNIIGAGAGGYSAAERPAVIAAHNYVIHETLPYPVDAMEHVLLQQLIGAMRADVNVVNSDHCRFMLLDNARRYLAPAMVERIESRLEKINYGTLEADLVPQEREPNPVPIIAYNHRLQGYKKFPETLVILQELWDEGLRFRLRVMNNTADGMARIRSYPFVEIKLAATRVDYLKYLRDCDLNVTNSVHETFCIAAIESMALGQPLVAPDGITFPEITNAKALAYPFLYATRDQQKQALRALLGSPELRAEWGRKLSAHVQANYGQDLWATRYVDLFQRTQAANALSLEPDGEEWLRSSLAKLPPGGEPIRDFFNRVANKEVAGRVIYGNQSLPMVKIVRVVRHLGGRVEMRGGEQMVMG